MRAIVDLDKSKGELLLDGVERQTMPAYEWRKLIALVPAETGWWGDIVGEHFEENYPLAELLTSLSLSKDVLEWQVRRLSSGERQRLGFVRALALKPKILLLDEPTAALDEKTTKQVESIIKQQAKSGVGIIIITHDEKQAKRLADKSYLLENGALKQLGGKKSNG